MATMNVLGSEIYYEIKGTGMPVIMLHGWGMDHRIMSGCMEPVFENKEEEYKRIYIDLPGMGKSVASAHIKTSDDMLEALFVFLDKIISKEKFIVVGESYGGYLARAMVHKRAAQIFGIILICPLVKPENRVDDLERLQIKDWAFTFDVDTLKKSFDKPALLVTKRCDSDDCYKEQFGLLDIYKKATFMVFDETAHKLELEQQEQFVSAVRNWLVAQEF